MSAGTASLSGANNQGYPGSNSIGIRRAPTFTTAIAFEITPVKATAVQTQVQSMLAKSSKILSKDTIIVAVDGDGLVLRGLAKDDHERRLAEALVRLTPGVRNVRNELAVPETAPNPRRVPQ
jgi:osmotically-inducible protein OsmY